METMSSDAFPSVWGSLNREWHFRIYSAGEAELLVNLITVLWDRTSVYREVLAADPDTRATSVAQHAEVLRRLQVGDASAAARAMRQHIRRGTTDMRAAEIAWGRAGTTMLHRAHTPRSRSKDGPPITASNYVAIEIRAEILKGSLQAGSRLDQQVLAKRFGVSIIPVREGLKRLEAEGLVRMSPRRGAFVAQLTLQELTEISWIRERLEDLAIRLAAPHLSDPHLRELEDLNVKMARMASNVQPSVWSEVNREWHFKIYAAGDSELLVQMIAVLWDRTSLYREVLATSQGIARSAEVQHGSVAQHAEMLRRLRVGDASGTARLMRQHIRRAIRDMRATEAGVSTGMRAMRSDGR